MRAANKCFTYIVPRRVLISRRLDGIRNEAEDGTDPQQQRKAAKQLYAKLHPFWSRLWWTQLVRSIPSQNFFSTIRCMTLNDMKSNITVQLMVLGISLLLASPLLLTVSQ